MADILTIEGLSALLAAAAAGTYCWFGVRFSAGCGCHRGAVCGCADVVGCLYFVDYCGGVEDMCVRRATLVGVVGGVWVGG